MTTKTYLLILVAGIIALFVAIFQYYFKAKRKATQQILFAFLRFVSVFTLLLLLVNPVIESIKTQVEKPDLILLSDNSKSISYLKQDEALVQKVLQLKEDKTLQSRFELNHYFFGENLKDTVSEKFKDSQTKISEVLTNIQNLHRKPNTAIVLLTDGNQTYGENYSYYTSKNNQFIYSLALGDTTKFEDLKIAKLNVNKYAYLNNKFPVEVLVNYQGKSVVKAKLEIVQGSKKIHTEILTLSPEKKAQFITTHVKALKSGLQSYKVVVSPLTGEKNTANNVKRFVVETIDQKTNILLVSAINHPDLGAIKRSIESNERRRLVIKKPTEVKSVEEYQLVILYQPQTSFKNVYGLIKEKQLPQLTITGKHTQWDFVNGLGQDYTKVPAKQTEEVVPVLASSFEIFNTDSFETSNYPPLESTFGNVVFKGNYETLLFKKIAGVETNYPLLTFWESKAVLFGEGIWKWRMSDFKNEKEFTNFDTFFGKVVQYLSNKKSKTRLTTEYTKTYYTNTPIKLTASYFNKNYEFDAKAKLIAIVTNKNSKGIKKVPLVIKNNFYEADFSDFPIGDYTFTIKVEGQSIQSSGGFSILDFDIEKQFYNPNIENLTQLSVNSGAALFYPNQTEELIKALLENENLKSIEKSTIQKKPLIHWKYLLGLLLLSFSLEWFIRKYKGLI